MKIKIEIELRDEIDLASYNRMKDCLDAGMLNFLEKYPGKPKENENDADFCIELSYKSEN